MLGGRISNQDEDEVEDELDALEAEITGVSFPNVSSADLLVKEGALSDASTAGLGAKERAKASQRQEEEIEEGRVAMLA